MVESEPVPAGRIDTDEEVSVSPPELEDSMQILKRLSDPGCRAILLGTGRPRTAAELCERCELPTSTVYRKLEALSDAGLLEETRRISDHGNHPVQYRRRVDHVEVTFGDQVVRVSADPDATND